MISVTLRIASSTSVMVLPAWSTSTVPSSTRSTLEKIRDLISLAASAERPARLRTSVATTAKPRPCSPARAASTAAFSARILVWKAMPSITPMMSAIFLDDALIPFMVSTTFETISPPLPATLDALWASTLAWRVFSAFCFTVELSSSMEAAVSSSALAWCSVRWLRSLFPCEISALAVATSSEPSRTVATTSVSDTCMRAMAAITLCWSPWRTARVTLRSPAATLAATSDNCAGSAPSARPRSRAISQLTPLPISSMAAPSTSIKVLDLSASDCASAASFSAMFFCNARESSTALNTTFCEARTSPSSACMAASFWPSAASCKTWSMPWL